MADLDVSEILDDPDFRDDGLICKRMTQTVSASGIASNDPTETEFSAVVISASGDRLNRLAEGSRTSGSITLYTRFNLIPGSDAEDADVVAWRGRDYTVSSVKDWGHFGRGFISADCDLIQLRG